MSAVDFTDQRSYLFSFSLKFLNFLGIIFTRVDNNNNNVNIKTVQSKVINSQSSNTILLL